MNAPSPALFKLYIEEIEIHLDKINVNPPCLVNTVVAISLYIDNVVMLSKSWLGLQSLGGGLFIKNLYDVHGLLWKWTPYIQEVCKGKQM